MNYYIGDLHFGHKNVINFDQRPFATVEEMDEALIKAWNRKVQKDDTVYVIGDFAYKNEKPEEWYLEQLPGKKYLIMGNHDAKLLKNNVAMSYFEGVDKMMHVMDEKNHVCLCHFPLAEWNGFHKGSWHIYGHVHNKETESVKYMKTLDKALNAGCMLNHYEPVSLQELIANQRK